ncbi:MAG: glycyl-radical enzyme activating protein [Clostridia bacterium]|nr:glycyl-radical enzyme activating protein [Clostridia bacterium]
MTGFVFALKRFAVHDGPGIRTTLFLKGCPLSCLWCHNPEGISYKREIALYTHKCISCKKCLSVCTENAQLFEFRSIDREKCLLCGACEDACLNGAITVFGKEMTVQDAFNAVTEDKDFYLSSDGGVTVSGGECLMQADFVQELLKLLKEDGIHTAVDTCGYVPKDAFTKVMPYTDVFLYDIKAFSEETHIKCTGRSNKLIWDNLKYITDNGKKCIIRFPLIPEYNDFEAELIAKKLSEFKNIEAVDVLKYHNFSSSKYEALSLKNTMPQVEMPTDEMHKNIKSLFASYGLKVNN